MSVVDDGQEDDRDTSIAALTLEDVDEQSIKMSIQFRDTGAITKDISEPDVLEIRLLDPNLFVDAETFEPIDT